MEKNKLLMIVIIVLLVVLLGSVAGVSFFVFKTLGEQKDSVESDRPLQEITEFKASQIEEYPLNEGEDLTSNLSVSIGENGKEVNHIIKASVTLGLYNNEDDKEAKKELERVKGELDVSSAVTKDAILQVFRSFTYEELNASEGLEALKEAITVKLQDLFDTYVIVDVYIFMITQ